MVGLHWLPWINNSRSGSITITSTKQEQDMSPACLCIRKNTTCHHVCRIVALSTLFLCLFVTCVSLSVLYNSEPDGKPEKKSRIFEYQNVTDSLQALTKTNTELRRETETLKEQTRLLNRTSAKLLSVNLALSLESAELAQSTSNLTSANLQLTQELERQVQITSEHEDKELNMTRTIKHLKESNTQQEEERRRLSETTGLLRDELLQVKRENQELLEINDKFHIEVKNLSEKLEALLNDGCEELNVQLQERVTELREQKQNLSRVLMEEREEAAEREERRREQGDRMTEEVRSLQEAYHSLDLYCPVVNHETNERSCKRCPDSWRHFDSKCYYFSPHTLTWSSSRAWCQTQGGDLLIINSEEEQSFIFESSRAVQQSGSRLWIGMTDAEVEGDWSWVDGGSLSSDVQFWLSRPGVGTEPDDWKQDDPSGEDCGHIDTTEDTHTSWMDGSCRIPYRWICEKSV
ncbi:C-type lectin domain family 10 member A-like [Notolabrus celidotus]|uniref:C-type lectin domain family 10 member A-like n=1 Tax=Notolabrus celidotus TaxID=1203425 RepID=UPI00148F9B8F|nr:C-type lectin domain family 10 member A-like [Notolabrus celidotus]